MSQREPDDTPKSADTPTHERGRGDYYYDDATGYELYQPEEDEVGEEGEDLMSVPPAVADGSQL
jgi:hypothetical protein